MPRSLNLYYYGVTHQERLRAIADMRLRELPGVPVPACKCRRCQVGQPASTVLELYEAMQGDTDEVCEIAAALFKDGWSGTIEELLQTSRALGTK